LQQAESSSRKAANGSTGSGRIEVFDYPDSPDASSTPGSPSGWYGWGEEEQADDKPLAPPANDENGKRVEVQPPVDFEKRLDEEKRRAFDAGREQGAKAEHDAQAAAREVADKERTRQAAKLLADFTEERDRYMQTVEHEVVKLALAVAARILRREAQMDPLLLTGAVRVALGQLSGSTQVRLLVPAAELDLWSQAMSLVPNLAVKPVVTADEEMRLGDCRIETEMGSVDLGIRAQLGEIERGFFDRAGGAVAGGSESAADKRAGTIEAVGASRS
jgi:flagellar assembly protein FliH